MHRFLIAAIGLFGFQAQAEVPDVMTDIAPVHSLVAQVMGDLGTPRLLLTPDHDPHHFQMRPSQVRALASADLVIWMGEAMTPWLGSSVENLGNAPSLELLDIDPLPMTITGNVAEILDPQDMADHKGGHGDEHDDDHGHDHGHDHGGGIDPHAWLDPVNAQLFLHEIAETLATLDPENAATYFANAEAAQMTLTDLTTRLTEELAPMRGTSLIPYHNAYRYFFIRFNLRAVGSISGVDGLAPSAAQLREVQTALATSDTACLFTEPGANAKLIKTVAPNAPAILPQLDALNAHHPLGPAYYGILLQNMADTIRTCQTP